MVPLGATVELTAQPGDLPIWALPGSFYSVERKEFNPDGNLVYLIKAIQPPHLRWWAPRFVFKVLESA